MSCDNLPTVNTLPSNNYYGSEEFWDDIGSIINKTEPTIPTTVLELDGDVIELPKDTRMLYNEPKFLQYTDTTEDAIFKRMKIPTNDIEDSDDESVEIDPDPTVQRISEVEDDHFSTENFNKILIKDFNENKREFKLLVDNFYGNHTQSLDPYGRNMPDNKKIASDNANKDISKARKSARMEEKGMLFSTEKFGTSTKRKADGVGDKNTDGNGNNSGESVEYVTEYSASKRYKPEDEQQLSSCFEGSSSLQ